MTKLLPSILPSLYNKPSIWCVVFTSTFIDCFIGDWFHMAILIIVGNIWETRSLSNVWSNFFDKIMPTMYANWGFLFKDILAYRFVPTHIRATFDHALSTVFSGIFSFIENE